LEVVHLRDEAVRLLRRREDYYYGYKGNFKKIKKGSKENLKLCSEIAGIAGVGKEKR